MNGGLYCKPFGSILQHSEDWEGWVGKVDFDRNLRRSSWFGVLWLLFFCCHDGYGLDMRI